MVNQSTFADRLLNAAAVPPIGLKVWNGADPANRFNVYRNNVMSSLIDALAGSYPVVCALVGEEFFRAVAAEFVRSAPPQSPVLAWYGKSFADFLVNYPPVASLPYLPEVARFEWMLIESLHAADASSMDAPDWQTLLEAEELLSKVTFVFHPAARIFFSSYPVISIWHAHQDDDAEIEMQNIDMRAPEGALITREELSVQISPIDRAASDFMAALQSGRGLIQSVPAADFDLAASLALIISAKAIVSINMRNADP